MDGGFMGPPIENIDNSTLDEFCCKAEDQSGSWQRKRG